MNRCRLSRTSTIQFINQKIHKWTCLSIKQLLTLYNLKLKYLINVDFDYITGIKYDLKNTNKQINNKCIDNKPESNNKLTAIQPLR